MKKGVWEFKGEEVKGSRGEQRYSARHKGRRGEGKSARSINGENRESVCRSSLHGRES